MLFVVLTHSCMKSGKGAFGKRLLFSAGCMQCILERNKTATKKLNEMLSGKTIRPHQDISTEIQSDTGFRS